MHRKILVSLGILFLLTSFSLATTYNVPGDYATVQEAIDVCAPNNNDEVIVGDGTWTGDGNVALDFGGRAITVRSLNGPANCTIDCGGADRGFYFHNGEGLGSVVEGFTIINGSADFGGAIECDGASPTINNCVFENNAAELDGGGIDIFYGSPQITDCVFRNNTANGYGDSVGGGIAIYGDAPTGGPPTIKNCLFDENSAALSGGAIDLYDSNATITNCTVVGNTASADFGGIYANDISDPTITITITNSIFWNNSGDLSYDYDTATVTVTFSCIEDGDLGEISNISADPMFRTGVEGDYYLSQIDAGQLVDSPCIDLGDSLATAHFAAGAYVTRTSNGPDEGDVDMGYHYPNNGVVGMFDLVTEVNGIGGSIAPASNPYVQFSDVVLTATPADNSYYFNGWTGTNDDASMSMSNVVTMTTDPNTVKVSFVKRTTYLLTKEVAVSGGGSLVSTPSGLSDSDLFYAGNDADLTANPDSGYVIKGWTITNVDTGEITDPGHSDPDLSVTMDANSLVTVEFISGSFRLTTTVVGGNGTVEPRRDYFDYNTEVPVFAYPADDYKVKSWRNTDDDTSIDPNNFVTMTGDIAVEVEFELIPYFELTTEVIGYGGTITPYLPVPNDYLEGSVVPLIATPDAGYIVKGWTGTDNDWQRGEFDLWSDLDHYNTVTMDANSVVTVEFEHEPPATYWIETNVIDSGDGIHGTIDPTSGYWGIYEGQIIDVNAIPDPGYRVWKWHTSDMPGQPIDPDLNDPNHITVTVTADGTYARVEFRPVGLPMGTIQVRDRDSHSVVKTLPLGDTIQDAIDDAIADTANFDFVNTFPEIFVAEGTYDGLGNYDLDLKGYPMFVVSELGPEYTTIDCQGLGRGFVFNDGSNPDWKIEGFTIINGTGDYGGGILLDGTTLDFWGGVGAVENCIFTNNFASDGGGAIACVNTDFVAINATSLQAMKDQRAALDLPGPPIRIHNCKIYNNTTSGEGGGIYAALSSPVISNTEIRFNSASDSSYAAGHGGGIFCQKDRTPVQAHAGLLALTNVHEPMPELINCLITENTSMDNMGGGIYAVDCAPFINLSTIAYNDGFDVYDGIAVEYFTPTVPIRNSIVWHPNGDDLYEIEAEYSCIEDGDAGTGNIATNPNWIAGPLTDPLDPIIGFYLPQAPGGCVDAGEPVPAFTNLVGVYQLGSGITTSISNAQDAGNMDMGYHYHPSTKSRVVTLTLYSDFDGSLEFSDGGIVLGVVPPDTTYVHTIVLSDWGSSTWINLRAIAENGYRVQSWSGTDNDLTFGTYNSVTMMGNQSVVVNFELAVIRTLLFPGHGEYNTLQDAINESRSGDTIVVQSGRYVGTGFYVYGKDITITSTDPNEPDVVANTIIDCANQIERGFMLIGTGNPGGHITLSGITIANAAFGDVTRVALGSRYDPGTNGSSASSVVGGGIYVSGDHVISNMVIRNCRIFGNNGGVGRPGGNIEDDPPDNNPVGGDGGDGGGAFGGGIYVASGAPQILNCIIDGCEVTGGDGAVGSEGGSNGDVDYSGVNVGGRGGNSGMGAGGGIYVNASGGFPTIKDCTITNCLAEGGIGGVGGDGAARWSTGGAGGTPGAAFGGGMYIAGDGNYIIEGCSIVDCLADGGLGGNGGERDGIADGAFGGGTNDDPLQGDPEQYTAKGGGIYFGNGVTAQLIDCNIENNEVIGSISGLGSVASWGHRLEPTKHYQMASFGAGIYGDYFSHVEIADSVISGNAITYDPADEPFYGDPPAPVDQPITGFELYYRNYNFGYGGGLAFADESEVTILNSDIETNGGPIGGGFYGMGMRELHIADSNFIDNSSNFGGGLFAIDTIWAEIIDNRVTGNSASLYVEPYYGEALPDDNTNDLYGAGGGLYLFTSDALVKDNVITENETSGSGGGVYLGGHPESIMPQALAIPELINCLITENVSVFDGGGVSVNWNAKVDVFNCTIADNFVSETEGFGGGLYASYDSNSIVTDSIIWDNIASDGAQLAVSGSSVYQAASYPSSITVTHSDIQSSGHYVEEGSEIVGWIENNNSWDPNTYNIDTDPLFVGGYFLSQTVTGQLVDSPCVNTGSGYAADPDIAMDTYTTRIDSVPDDGDPGDPNAIVDMGYHYALFELPTSELTVEIVNEDGTVVSEGVYDPNGYYEIFGDHGSVRIYDLDGYNYVPGVSSTYSGVFTTVSLIAIPDPGWRVAQWSDVDGGTNWKVNEVTVTMDIDRSVKVWFQDNVANKIVVPTPQFPTIQSGINMATNGDEVIVSPGTYYIDDPNGINFHGKSVTLMSTDPNDPEITAATIIDVRASRYQSGRAFHFHSGEDNNTVVKGFTIQNGYIMNYLGRDAYEFETIENDDGTFSVIPVSYGANGEDAPPDYFDSLYYNLYSYYSYYYSYYSYYSPFFYSGYNSPYLLAGLSDPNGYGGGILCENASSPTILNCVITDCTVSGGQGGNGGNVPRGTNVPSEIAQLPGGNGGSGFGNGYGGAIACIDNSNPIIESCIIKNNTAMGGSGGDGGDGGDGDGGYGGNGGGAYGYGNGGGIYCQSGSSPTIIDCEFTNNVASEGRPGRGGFNGAHADSNYGGQGPVNSFGQVAGGAIWSDASESSITIVNCRFTNNRAYEAEYYAYYNYDFYNTEYELIELYTRGGAIYADNSTTITLDNCDFTENFGGALFCGAESDITIDGCTFTGNMGLSQSDSLEKGSFESGEDDAYDPFGYYGDYIDALEGQAGGNLESPAGAVDLGPFGLLTVVNSDFRDNFTSDHGGAVHSRSDVSFTTSSFSGNSAGGNGGAVYIFENVDPNYLGVPITNLSLTIDTCSFSGNTAFAGGVHAGTALGGGGLCADHFEGSITDTYFLGNTSQNGGGLCLVDGIVDITGGGINANTARANYGLGGGFACINTDTVISDCMIQDNKLTGDDSRGGGVAFYGGDAAMAQVMSNCLVTGNESVSDGGGVYCAFEANAEISNTTFSDNSAGTYGGAIACNWDADPNIIDSIFNNCGPYAISEEDTNGAKVTYSLFNNNAVADYAVYDSITDSITQSASYTSDDTTTNFDGDPEFVAGPIGNHYLYQTLSDAVDAGSADAIDIVSLSDPNNTMADYTTDPNGGLDELRVDLGYHYPNAVDVEKYKLTVTVFGGHGTADLIGTGEYLAGSAVTITATPDAGYRIDTWSGGTVNDSTKELVNIVVMGSDKNIEIRFEQPSTLVVGSTSEYTSIQRTIEAAEDGDMVLVPEGVYDAVGPQYDGWDGENWLGELSQIRIINKSVTLSGLNPDNPDAVAATVLDGYHITIANAGPQTLIQGLTITNSRMQIFNSKCRLQNVDFVGNHWRGLNGIDGGSPPTTPGGEDGYDGTGIFGGALAIYNSSPIIANTRFIDCSATGGDGGDGEVGKAAHPIGGDGGWAGKAHGGAVYITTESHPEFYGCVFENCFAQGGNGGDGGDDGPGVNHGGRGGNWEWSDSLEELYWHFSFWWDGWSYGYMFDEKYGPYARFEDNWQYQSYGTWGGFGDWSADWSVRDWENYWRDYNSYIWPTWRTFTTIHFTYTPYTGTYDPHWEYSGYGGAVYCRDSSSMKFEDCIFNNNSTLGGFSGVGGNNWPKPDRPISMENFGGAVYVKEDCNVEFTGCLFDDNVADRSLAEDNDDYYVSYGGAVAFEENVTARFDECTFTDNESCIGGAVYWKDSDVTIENSDLQTNAAYHGGGMYSLDSTSKIINSTVIANNATLAPELSIVDNSSGDIGGDTGDDTGGTEEPETPVPSAVELGITFGRGGGFYSLSSKSEVIDSVFKGNAASASGGGIFFIGSDQDYGYESIVKNSLIAGNSSGRDGAGISVNWYSDIDIANSTIADNVVTGARSIGGGLYTSYSSVSDITNSIVWGNTAIDGSQLAANGGNLFFPYPSTIGITYSDVQTQTTNVRPEAIDLVFLIDTTGSMGDDIDAVRIAMAEILDRIAEYFPDYRIAVVDYRDYPEDPYGSEGVDYLYSDKTEFTSNPVRIQAAIDALTLGSGMDWRESVYSGLMHCIINDEVDVDAIGYVEGDPLTHTYVHSLGGWRTGDEVKRVIVLMADAPPHEPEPYGEFYSSDVVIEAALGDPFVADDISIFSVLTGPVADEITSSFSRMAAATGGMVLTESDTDNIADAFLTTIDILAKPATPIHVADDCAITGWFVDSSIWDPNGTNISADPLFIGDYYLNQFDAGQRIQSPCVDAGDPNNNFGMDAYSTRTNSLPDAFDGVDPNSAIVDMGYHRALFEVPQHTLVVLPADIDGLDPIELELEAYDKDLRDYIVSAESVDGSYLTIEDQYTTVRIELTGTPPVPEGYQVQWIGTDDDEVAGTVNYVTLSEDKVVYVTFVKQYKLTVELYEFESIDFEGSSVSILDGYYNRDEVVSVVLPDLIELYGTLPDGFEPNDLSDFQVDWTGTDNDYSVDANNLVTMNEDGKVVKVRYERKRPEYYAVIVGITDYEGFGSDLSWPTNDVMSVYDALEGSADWQAENIAMLRDTEATKNAIHEAIQEMATRIDQDDKFLFYFSGHGSTSDDIEPLDEVDGVEEYLVTYDFDNISDDEFSDWLSIENLGTEHYVVFLDTCFTDRSTGGMSSSVISRGLGMHLPAQGDGFAYDLTSNGSGVALSAGDATQSAWESSVLRHGVFTYYLLEAMGGDGDEATIDDGDSVIDSEYDFENGWISAEECFEYIKPKVNMWMEANEDNFLPMIDVRQTVTLYDANKAEIGNTNEQEFITTATSATDEPDIIDVAGGITIQDAIRLARDGDIVRLPTGTYDGSGIYVDKEITITSENPDDPDVVAATIISSDGYLGRALIFTRSAGKGTLLNGITLARGEWYKVDAEDGENGTEATETEPATLGHIDGYDGYSVEGAGIYCSPGSSPTIANCVIRDFHVRGGHAGNGVQSDVPVPINGRGGWGGWARGGGIYIGEGASPTIINTEISGCSATGGNGGNGADASIITDEIFGDYEIIAGFGGLWSNAYFAPWEMMGYEGPFKYYTGMGGGVYCAENSSPTFISCTITGNRTQGGISGLGGAALVGSERYPQYVYEIPSFGGGVYCAAYSNVVFRGCTIEGNYASRDLPDDGNYDWSGAGDGPGGHTRDETDNIDPYLGHGGGLAFEDGAIVIFDDYITQRAETTPSVVGSNEADRGGGIYWDGAGPEIYGITVAGNKAYQGAGIYGSQGSVYMERCLITGNTAGDVEIAEVEDPDADPDPDPDPVVEEVVLGRGGGIYLTAIAAEITDTTITSNVASASGGGLFFTDVSDEPSVVKNCLIVNNEAHRDGGGISVNWYAKPIITNCTVVGNKATGDFGELAETGFGGGMYCSYHSTTVVRDSIFWGNFAYSSGDQITLGTGFEFDPRPSTLDIAFSAIQGGVEESGIHKDDGCELIYDTATYMTQDPLFESVGDQLEGNYYLSPSSPYVDAGSGSASGYDMDAGVLTPLMSEPVRVKLSRGYTIDIDNLFDTQAVGLGYHYPMTFTDICGLCDAAPDGGTEHINGDGVINLSDFAELTLKWGMMDCDFLNEWCDGTDVTVDSLVDSDDLFVFTNCWLAKDNQTPEHDPLVWIEEPNSIDAYTENPSSYRIRMSVKPAFDNWTGDEVEYYFCTSENDYYKLDKIPGSDDPNWMGDPSYDEGNWQPSNVFEDVYDGDDPVTEDNFPLRGYVVRARERRSTGIYNITAGKDLFRSTQFGMEKNPPDDGQWLVEYGPDLDGDGEPDSIITDGRPSLQNQNSVKMTAATAVDYDINGVPYTSQTYGSGQPRVLYIFERKRDGISEVKTDPQASPIWEDTGLLANETYEYTVCTIDDPYENLGNESPSVAVLIGEIDNSAPIPDPVITSAYREYQGEFYDFVIAAVATDPEENGVWYQFEISGESQSLQTSEILQNQTAQVGQKTYRVRYWDGVGNYTAWSAPVSVDWVAP